MKQRICLILLITLLILMAGCWDNIDLEERTSVVAIGIDRPKKNKRLFTVTYQIPIPQRIIGGAGGEGGKATIVLSATGPTINEASMRLQERLNQEIFLGHTRVLVISEEVARGGIQDILDTFRRSPQMRRLMWPMITKGSAKHMLQTNTKLEQIPTIYIMDLVENGARYGLFPDISLGKFFNDLSDESREPILNYVLSTENEYKWLGAAVFLKDRMIGELNENEVWSLLHLRDEKKGVSFDVACGKSADKKTLYATFNPKTIEVKRKFVPRGESYYASYRVRLEGDIIESQCPLDFSKEKNLVAIQSELNKVATKRAQDLIAKLQNKYKLDALGLGTFVRATHPLWWNDDKWREVFPKGQIDVKYSVLIRRTGMETK